MQQRIAAVLPSLIDQYQEDRRKREQQGHSVCAKKIKDAGQQYHHRRISFPNASEVQITPNADHLKQRRARSGRAPVAKPETGRAGDQRPVFPVIIVINTAYSGKMHRKGKKNNPYEKQRIPVKNQAQCFF